MIARSSREVSEASDPAKMGDAESSVAVLAGRGRWASALIVFADLKAADYSGSAEPWEDFSAAVLAKLDGVAIWLDRQPPASFQQMRRGGLTVDLFLALWIDDNQVDLSLPASLLLSCGRLGLDIVMVSND